MTTLGFTITVLFLALALLAGLGAAFDRLNRHGVHRAALLDADEARARAMSEYYLAAHGSESY